MKDGDYVIRIWPSGIITMGQAISHNFKNKSLVFLSLESYDKEGGVMENKIYGYISYTEYTHRLATEIEIEVFKTRGELKLKEEDVIIYSRDIKLKSILD